MQYFIFLKKVGDKMAFTNTGFTINGLSNAELGIASTPYIVRTDSQIETPCIGNKKIIESYVPYSDCPYFYGTQKEPISFKLKFSESISISTNFTLSPY